ncbi:MAG: SHOCT domain-containing protein [Woeseiaceae bacterium]
MKFILRTLLIYVAGLSIALAQTTGIADQAENATVSERERLGNQRIQIEAEMRAREEQRRLEEAEQVRLRAEQAAARSEMAAAQNAQPDAREAAGSADMYRTLEQLRLLGELKDDGYVTEEEFQRIKQRILDSRL